MYLKAALQRTDHVKCQLLGAERYSSTPRMAHGS
jgi:hypothetical protein